MDEAYKLRAEARRRTLVGGVASSFDELERRGFEFWQAADPAVRLRAMIDLHWEAWVLGGKRGDAPRFDGSTWGVGRFER